MYIKSLHTQLSSNRVMLYRVMRQCYLSVADLYRFVSCLKKPYQFLLQLLQGNARAELMHLVPMPYTIFIYF